MPKSIDLFNHYLPPEYYDRIIALGGNAHMMNRARKMPAMSDLSYRLEKIRSILTVDEENVNQRIHLLLSMQYLAEQMRES